MVGHLQQLLSFCFFCSSDGFYSEMVRVMNLYPKVEGSTRNHLIFTYTVSKKATLMLHIITLVHINQFR